MRFTFFTTVSVAAISAVGTNAVLFDDQYAPEELAQIELTDDQLLELSEDQFAQLLSEIELNNLDNQYAQIEGDSQSESSSSSSGSSSSGSDSSGSNNDAQIDAESDSENIYGLAQINAEIEAEEEAALLAQIDSEIEAEAFAAVQEDALDYFKTFLAQIGINENEQLFAQLGEAMTEEQLGLMAMTPEIYMGLAQLANDYHNNKAEAVSQVLAQVNTDDESELAELEQILAQMDTQEINEVQEMLAQTASEAEW